MVTNEINSNRKVFISFLVIGLIGLLFVIVFSNMRTALNPLDTSTTSNTSTLLVLDGSTYNLDDGIASFSATRLNQTWLEFDGVDDNVQVPYSDDYFTRDNITVSAWVKLNELASDHGNNMYWIENRNGTSGGFEFRISSANNEFDWDVYGLSDSTVSGDTTPAETDRWYHLLFQYDGAEMQTYIDAGLELKDDSTGTIGGTSDDLQIGRFTTQTTRSWNGSIEEVRIYNRSLTHNERINLYYSSPQSTQLVPFLYYHIINDSESGDTVINESQFTEQMQYLASNGFNTISFEQYGNWTRNEISYNKPIVIMFDDADLSVYETASPIMDSLGINSNIAVITNFAITGQSNSMNWTQLQNLSDRGNYFITSHSTNGTNYDSLASATRLLLFNQSKNDIIGNLSITPKSFIFPQNLRNPTINNECSIFYDYCTGRGSDYPTVSYTNKNSNHTSGELRRVTVRNTTTISQFASIVEAGNPSYYNSDDPNSINSLTLHFNENQGTTAYDSSPNANNGTISGATWNNDGVDVTLTDNVDYSLTESTGLFSIINSELFFSQIDLSYSYSVTQGDYSEVIDDLTGGATTFFSFSNVWFRLMAIALVIVIVITVIRKTTESSQFAS